MAKGSEKLKEPSNREFTRLNLEFDECVSSSRFHVGVRFNYFISFTTIFFGLVAAFHLVWTTEPDVFGKLKPWFLFAISLFGFFTAIVAIIIELRTYQIFRAADKQADLLEERMGIKHGIRKIYAEPLPPYRFLKIPLRHTVAIGFFYGLIAFVWTLLIIFSVYEILVYEPTKREVHYEQRI